MRNSGEVWLNGQLVSPPPGAGRGGAVAAAAAPAAAGAVVGRGAAAVAVATPAAPAAGAPAAGAGRGARGAGPAGAAAPAPAAAGGGGRGNATGVFELPAGALRVGQNVVTARITKPRTTAASSARPTCCSCRWGRRGRRSPGTWKYRIERQTNAGQMYAGPRDLATHVAFTRPAASPAAWPPASTLPVPGAAPAAPLTAAEQQRFNAGREVYQTICVSCHQPDGLGADKVAASIVGSPLALGAPSVPARILLHGKQGSVGLMPALGASLSDEQIASVLTYIRREWGHGGAPSIRRPSPRRARPRVAARGRGRRTSWRR